MTPWKTLSRETILNHSKYLAVENHTVELPDGKVIDDWPWVISPDYVNVVAITVRNEFLFFRQTKYSVDGTTIAPVGGYLEPGEDFLAAAQRELLEETGFEAPDWIHLGDYIVDGNRGAGYAHFYLAQKAHCVKEANADDLEEQQLLLLNQTEVEAALAGGVFKVLGWASIVALALIHLRE